MTTPMHSSSDLAPPSAHLTSSDNPQCSAAHVTSPGAQVLRLQLDRGHHHTCICTAQLHVASWGPHSPRRPFLLLASHLIFRDEGLQQLQGLLSVFELAINPTTSRC